MLPPTLTRLLPEHESNETLTSAAPTTSASARRLRRTLHRLLFMRLLSRFISGRVPDRRSVHTILDRRGHVVGQVDAEEGGVVGGPTRRRNLDHPHIVERGLARVEVRIASGWPAARRRSYWRRSPRPRRPCCRPLRDSGRRCRCCGPSQTNGPAPLPPGAQRRPEVECLGGRSQRHLPPPLGASRSRNDQAESDRRVLSHELGGLAHRRPPLLRVTRP